MKKIESAIKPYLKKEKLDIRPGDTVKVHQKIKEASKKKEGIKERIQVFEGVVLARKHGKEIGSTITVRKVIGGIGVERIFPLHLPTIEKIEVVKRSKVRKAKLYHLRKAKGKRARLKKKEFIKEVTETKEEVKEKASINEGEKQEPKEKTETKENETPASKEEVKEVENPPENGETPAAEIEENKQER